ncbi:helix-hairpin-helix domain-containing protein [Noviherbaspirillum sp. CPCC 100848]|uniref:Helix-hairpin-helix domain-containing protein n=1 Tax=Noviherbaspirillum album TaxID=3080276 RepID=A0ABU6J5I0_9BURK|nr:helix-hairpin-helix domain-containing protein [Noviherbaspirillum sp. CPCC 100848]MEC4718671.1 helix-hairpin-helix domain-containing protein [Noviherbaspirillum sp. CPCC 100848]
MFKKSALAVILLAHFSLAFAQIDVNKADQAALDGIRGVGPKLSSAILDERKKGGNFKDWQDLESRVKGVGDKSAVRLSNAGLTVNGQARAANADQDAKSGDKKSAASASKVPVQAAGSKVEPRKEPAQ